MNRTAAALAAITIAAALALAGCGGGSGSSGGYGYAPPTSGSGPVSVARVGDAGEVLVDSKGFTLYLFERDENGRSSCYGDCASAWPPLMTSGAPQPGDGIEASKLGTTERRDGTTQVTYAGWPLYTYAVDAEPGEDNGTDVDSFGAAWYPLHPSGARAGE